ncbi:hypothetical protein TSAR_004300 [Trichomalopsis sarcophagae]|uniref:Uncharacterized protein n=1 Tax=Trichomalopsis sarcophagae TaxID=543379 RepID=A0A232EUR7_9HYME|nr:hypothetical protein TSAR_004300 [Trichomalopsis sarcophagae]
MKIEKMDDIKSKETECQNKITEENQMYYKKKIKNVECPFTWESGEVMYKKIEYSPNDCEEFIPLMKFIRCIVNVYRVVHNDTDTKSIFDNAHEEISIEAVIFILKSTKCYTELKQLLATETKTLNSSKKKQTSTIKACKSIAWSNNRRYGTTEAIKFIRDAISDNPNCDLWHFILGKLLRRERRDVKFNFTPDSEETDCFEKTYNMIYINPVYGVFLAQVYREESNTCNARRMYERVLRDNPQSDAILLKIALGFTTLRDFQKAKFCLDNTSKNSSGKSMFLHYQGLYHFKQQQYWIRSFSVF